MKWLLLILPALFFGCNKTTSRSSCYEGTVVYNGPTCGGEYTVIVQITKGKDIGQTWMGNDNCVQAHHVPDSLQSTGSKLYFTLHDNKIDSTPRICLTLYLSGTGTQIEPTQFLTGPCN